MLSFDSLLMTWVFAILGGILPTAVWLYFWLREDEHPEPKKFLLLAFLGGVLAVLVVLPIERWLSVVLEGNNFLVAVAALEEIVKFLIIGAFVLRIKENNEPVDSAIYLVTGALGFAALENAFFLIDPIGSQNIGLALATGNLRFLGATILHAVSSLMIGLSLGMAFYQSKASKWGHFAYGLLAAVLLHSLFNFFIMKDDTESIVLTLGILWVVAVVVVLMFERVKKIRPPEITSTNTL